VRIVPENRFELSEDRRIAISELLSILLPPRGIELPPGEVRITTDVNCVILERIQNLVAGQKPWSLSDSNILDCLLELKRR
jgi:hypothetical protein